MVVLVIKWVCVILNGIGVRLIGGVVVVVVLGVVLVGLWVLVVGWCGVLLVWGEDGGDFGWVV